MKPLSISKSNFGECLEMHNPSWRIPLRPSGDRHHWLEKLSLKKVGIL